MKTSDQIKEIIARRKGEGDFKGEGQLPAVERTLHQLHEVLQTLNNYKAFRETVLSQIKDQQGVYFDISGQDVLLESKVQSASPDSVIERVKQSIEEYESLQKRFSRDYVNISVIGLARQGKSTLLQSLSGLPNDVIPASDGLDCTGTKSIICNDVSMKEGEISTEVIFYSEDEIVAQVNDYLKNIGVSLRVNKLQDIPNVDLRTVDEATKGSMSLTEEALHLKKFVEHYDSYSASVGRVIPVKNASEIRQYVAQRDDNGDPCYIYLGVKEVQIRTRFPQYEIGNIRLVDTIGIGDTALGIREKLVQTLQNDSDSAILLIKPDAVGWHLSDEDTRFYDFISSQTTGHSLEKWLYCAINVSDYLHNRKMGKLASTILQEKLLLTNNIVMVDCRDKEDVSQNLLTPLLENIIAHLAEIDAEFVANANKSCEAAFHEYVSLCNKVNKVLNNAIKSAINIGGKFDDLYGKLPLSAQLKKLNDKFEGMTNQECQQIVTDIKQISDQLVTQVPTEESIQHIIDRGDESSYYHNVYSHYADILRSYISNEFERVTADTIYRMEESVKDEIIEIFRSETGGKLGEIRLNVKLAENQLWFEEFMNEKLDTYPAMQEAFQYILNYKISIEGNIEYIVNKCLSILNPASPDFSPINWKEIDNDAEAVEMIQQSLYNAIAEFSSTLLKKMSEVLLVPYNSFATRMRKVREKLIFSEDGKRDMRNFYRDNCSTIWREEFARLIQSETAYGEWNDYVAKLNDLCVKNNFIVQ